jgi:hypothetical protein
MKAQPEPIRFKGYKTFFYVADAKDELEYLLLTRFFFQASLFESKVGAFQSVSFYW